MTNKENVLEIMKGFRGKPSTTSQDYRNRGFMLDGHLNTVISALEDSARLDWLEGDNEFIGPGGRFSEAYQKWDGESPFRTAIDAAMKEK